MQYLLSILTSCCFLILPMISSAQDNVPVCTSLETLKANEGQQVMVFGELTRHHQLPHHPYILLLEHNEWIFLGNEAFFQGKTIKTHFVLIEGTVKLRNPNFQLANFQNKPLPSAMFMNASKPSLAEEPEKLIRSHPFIDKVSQIQGIPNCYSAKDVEQNLERWVAVYGLLSVKESQQVHFQSNRKNSWLQFDFLATQMPFSDKKHPGMVIAKFVKPHQAPIATLLQRGFPICKTAKQIKQYWGQLVTVTGKVKKQGKFKINAHTSLYLYNVPLGLRTDALQGQKIQFITRIYAYDAPHFFELPLFFNRPSFGQVGYIKSGLWYDKGKKNN